MSASDAVPPPIPIEKEDEIPWDQAFYVVSDLETTGFSRILHQIIEIVATILDADGDVVSNEPFHRLVRPRTPISPVITTLTGTRTALAGWGGGGKVGRLENPASLSCLFIFFLRHW